MQVIIDVVIWVLLWLVGFGLFNFLRKRGMTYTAKPWLVAGYFMVFTGIALIYFYKKLFSLNFFFSRTAVLVLLLTYLIAFLTYYFSHKYLSKPNRLIEKYKDQYFIRMDYRYLVSKSFDIFFQQTLVAVLVILLLLQGLALLEIILIFVFIFGIIHVINIPVAGKLFGIYYFIASIIGALLFPILILNVDGGLLYSYALHFFFYTISAVFFWVYAKKIS